MHSLGNCSEVGNGIVIAVGRVAGNMCSKLGKQVKKDGEFRAPKIVPMGIIKNSQNTEAKMIPASW
jgi:hypothetical protein